MTLLQALYIFVLCQCTSKRACRGC